VAHWVEEGGLNTLRGDEPVDQSRPVLGSYETWSQTMGSILTLAKIGGFLANRADVARRMLGASDADDAGYAFVEAWVTPPKGFAALPRKD
jgi:hypothetical protein